MNNKDHIVIIGAGIAGVFAAKGLRRDEFEGAITLIDEHQLPYDRPPLIKEFLRGEMSESEVFHHKEDFYVEKNIELKLGVKVTAIHPDSKTVSLENGETIEWTKLLIATGSDLNHLSDIDQHQFDNVYYIRTLEQAKDFKRQAMDSNHVVIIGSGFIGLEVAASLTVLGKKVTVLDFAEVPLERILGTEMGEYIASIHREKGVELLLGDVGEQYVGNGHVEKIVTKQGKTIECDAVLVAVGVKPDLTRVKDFLEIEDNGIVVNEYSQTSVKDIYAAGDCARWPDPISGEMIRIEHWENAFGQGKNAAKNMLNEDSTPYKRIPYFWSDQYDFNFEYLGHPLKWDQTIARGEIASDQFIMFYLQKKKIVGAFFVNQSKAVSDVKKLMKSGIEIEESILTDQSEKLSMILDS